MQQYYITKIPNKSGFHVLHTKNCFKCFISVHTLYLGEFDTCEEAVKVAQKYFKKVLPCDFCLPNCLPEEENPYKPNEHLFEDIQMPIKKH